MLAFGVERGSFKPAPTFQALEGMRCQQHLFVDPFVDLRENLPLDVQVHRISPFCPPKVTCLSCAMIAPLGFLALGADSDTNGRRGAH